MSNEELVDAIQQGDQARMGELWEQVSGLVKWKALQVITALQLRGNSCGVELDDLIQSGYIAMTEAVSTYPRGKCAFSTWFMYYVKTEFSELTGYRTKARQNEPLNNAASLDRPINPDNPDSGSFSDIVPDSKAAATLDAVEENLYRKQLHEALEAILEELTPEQSGVLRCRYFANMTLSAVGEHIGKGPERVRTIENQALRQMRRPRNRLRLSGFVDFDMYHGTGLGSFRASGSSIQERYLLAQERAAEAHGERSRPHGEN